MVSIFSQQHSPRCPSSIAMAYTGLLVPALTIIRQIHAVAIPAFPSLNTSSSVESLSTSSSCDSIHGCRTMWDIVYGCLATIFACTYTSFHPDVPDQTRIHINRTLAAIIGFFVPEYAVAMAASQCLEVRNHHKKIPFRGMLWMYMVFCPPSNHLHI